MLLCARRGSVSPLVSSQAKEALMDRRRPDADKSWAAGSPRRFRRGGLDGQRRPYGCAAGIGSSVSFARTNRQRSGTCRHKRSRGYRRQDAGSRITGPDACTTRWLSRYPPSNRAREDCRAGGTVLRLGDVVATTRSNRFSIMVSRSSPQPGRADVLIQLLPPAKHAYYLPTVGRSLAVH